MTPEIGQTTLYFVTKVKFNFGKKIFFSKVLIYLKKMLFFSIIRKFFIKIFKFQTLNKYKSTVHFKRLVKKREGLLRLNKNQWIRDHNYYQIKFYR